MTAYKRLYIDVETYSETDLTDCGVYRYVEDPNFEILLLAYAYDDEQVQVLDLTIDEIPGKLLNDIFDNHSLKKIAHNANFEMTCLSKYFNMECLPEDWICTAVRSSSLGLPRSLAAVGDALDFKEDEQKMKIGKALIRYFCIPCKPTKSNGNRTRNMPWHDIEKWKLFIEYNRQDVVTERAIMKALEIYPATLDKEKRLWNLDQRMSIEGVLVDDRLVSNIINYNEHHQVVLLKRAKQLSQLDNPSSIMQIKKWLCDRNINITSLTVEVVKELISKVEDADVKEFLKIRQELSKTSVSKYEAMYRAKCSDNRIRGMLLFYGANRTGRWSGRIVQLHNLPQNHILDLDLARSLVLDNDFETLEELYSSPTEIFSQLIRTSFIARLGHTFIVADYSAIEARVLAWLAGETWREEVFKNGGDIYCASASQMFKVPVVKNGINGHLRKKGKVAELALGYQGGIGALQAMDRDGALSEEEMESIISSWRAASPKIVEYWNNVENSAIGAITHPGVTVKLRNLSFQFIKDTLFIFLPSGRALAYRDAIVKQGAFKEEIRYMGQNQKTQKWEQVSTYGGKLVENITQAVARDCLAEAMLGLEAECLRPQFHVHDEVIIEVSKDSVHNLEDKIKKIMSLESVSWTKGLVLRAESYHTDYYLKD